MRHNADTQWNNTGYTHSLTADNLTHGHDVSLTHSRVAATHADRFTKRKFDTPQLDCRHGPG